MMTVAQTLEEVGYTDYGTMIHKHKNGSIYINIYYQRAPMAKLFIAPDVFKYMEDFLLSVDDIMKDTTLEAREIGEFEYAIISIPQSTM